MKQLTRFAVLLIGMTYLFASCQKAAELALISPKSLEFSADGGSETITFTANRDWHVSCLDSWVTVSPSSGSASDGALTVTISCHANTTYDDRTTTVTISMEEQSQSVSIKQQANKGVVLPKQVFDLQCDARSIDVEVLANVEYSVSISGNWIKQTGTRALTSKTLTFSIEENKSFDPREGKITITPQDSKIQEQVISVRQAQKDALNVEKNSYDMPYGGGEIEIKVEANVSFEVEPNAEWIHYTQTKALNSTTVCLKIDENTAYSSRIGTVEIKQQGGTLKHTITVLQDGRIAVASIELDQTTLTLKPGETATLVATVKPDNATDKTVTWMTSDATIATVDDTGKVLAIEEGSVVITAQAGEMTTTCSIVVKKSKKYLTFTSCGTTKLSLITPAESEIAPPTLYYSYDLITWEQWDYSPLSFTDTNPLYIYGDNKQGFSRYYNDREYRSRFFAEGSEFSCTGDIMSLINADKDVKVIPSSYCFSGLFSSCSLLISAPELPATVLKDACYRQMFYGCTSLTTAPKLPARTLANVCYDEMFRNCTSLVTVPGLSATTMAQLSCNAMFQGCTSLKVAPDLPARRLAWMCYSWMFYGCKSLITAPELPATTLADECYHFMFYGCTSLITAPELPATTLADGCYYRMFSHCKSLVNAPKLPATTLAMHCYAWMFEICQSLTNAPELPATSLVDGCYWGMFNGCKSLNYIKCLAVFEGDPKDYTTAWVAGVPSSGTFLKSSYANNWPSGSSGIPSGWEVQDYQE